MPGEYDRYNMQRLVSMTANIEGEDLGRVARHIARGPAQAAGEPPRGVTGRRARPGRADAADVRALAGGSRRGLTAGLVLAVVVIFLLLTAYFQSLRLALVGRARRCRRCSPGVALALLSSRGTTLNIQSFMGAIMAIGVAVANAILLVTFAERARREGAAARRRRPWTARSTGCGRS